MSHFRPVTPPYKALTLAESYEAKSAFRPALNIYQSLVKTSDISLRVKINLGNVHFKLYNYPLAIKYYKMALDQVGQNEKVTYSAIMHNIGLALVQQRLYSEAAFVFAYIVKENPDLRAYIHLILCAFAMRSIPKVRRYFPAMFTLPNLDQCEQIEQIEKLVFVLAPFLGEHEEDGFNWCLDAIRITNYAWIADNFEVARIVKLMKANKLKDALEYFHNFELNVRNLTEKSKINLSFVYLNLKMYPEVEELLKDCTSAKAYNNFGVWRMLLGDYNAARSAFQKAIGSEDKFYESIYNLALVERNMGNAKKAQELFQNLVEKFPFPCNSMTNYQMVQVTQNRKSIFNNLQANLVLFGLTYVTDPKILKKIAELYKALSNYKKSTWYFQEAYSVNPLL